KDYAEIRITDDNIRVISFPERLKSQFNESSNEFDSNIRRIRDAFNAISEDRFKITQTEIIHLLDKVKLNILQGTPIDASTNQKEIVFFDWLHYLFSDGVESEIKQLLNRVIFPLIIYYYFIEYNSARKDFSRHKIYLDSNIIIHILGINGKVQKLVAEEFIKLVAINNASVIISFETLKEIREVIKNEPNPDVKIFKLTEKQLATQLTENTKDCVESILTQYHVKIYFNEGNKLQNKERFNKWSDLYSSLENYKKSIKYHSCTENSIDHDINLIYISDTYKQINNFHDHFSPIATADQKLIHWFSDVMRKDFSMDSKALIPLYKFSLLLWREGKPSQSRFIGNTWAFIADNVNYFKKAGYDNIFRILRDNIESTIKPKNWRSTYLVLKNNLKEEDETQENFEHKILYAINETKKELGKGLQEKIEVLEKNIVEIQNQSKEEIISEIKKTNKMNALLEIIKKIFGFIIGKFL
ncbi:MAG TPA: hypothetical protein PK453_21775, partial [Leptospiraceae bacterium]|nr:hypothetical protein [Leptospiraceae bacterium]